jgi:hypothetical protein
MKILRNTHFLDNIAAIHHIQSTAICGIITPTGDNFPKYALGFDPPQR